jgi:glycosyltransferase involved in cell wall biosynthesis
VKITFIRSNTNAVGEYRVRHPRQALAALGHETHLITLDKTPQRVSNAELAGDLLVLQRQTSDTVFELLATLPPGDRPMVVYEIDDDYASWHSWDPVHAELGQDYCERVRSVMRRCDAVTCSTPTLAARIRADFPSMPIWVVPNAIDFQLRDWTGREDRAEHNLADKVVLGWTGSIHHTRDGGDMLAALPAIFDKYPEVVFLMQCDRSVYYEWTRPFFTPALRERLRWVPPQPFDWHPRVYSLFDINLAPLENTTFNRSKSDLRLIEGGAHGVPYVASKIAAYWEFSKRNGGIGGHLASTPGEWVEGISKLVDGEMDARGQSLKRYVKEARSLEVVAGQWQAAFEGVLAGGRGEAIAPLPEKGRNQPCACGSGQKQKRCECAGAYG